MSLYMFELVMSLCIYEKFPESVMKSIAGVFEYLTYMSAVTLSEVAMPSELWADLYDFIMTAFDILIASEPLRLYLAFAPKLKLWPSFCL